MVLLQYPYSSLVLLTFLGTATAFSSAAVRTSSSSTTRLWTATPTTKESEVLPPNKDIERAVQCATTFGLCDLDELENLATELEKLNECLYESSEELCEKEIEDRKDVAEVLRMQGELRLRMDYVDKANLFVNDVVAVHDMHDREEFFKILGEDAL